MDPAYLAGMRLLMAAIMLMPLFVRDWKRYAHVKLMKMMWVSLPAGLFLALHFISWNEGIRRTLAAHGTLIVNMVPVALPIMLWLTHRERVNRAEVIATLVSLAGIVWLAIEDYHFSPDYVVGDVTCFGSMLLFAAYLSLGRKNRNSESIFIYIVPVYLIASVICILVSLRRVDLILQNEPSDYLMAFLLALIPGTIGHTLINYAMRHLRGQIVGVMNVGQFLFAGIIGYLFFEEIPKPTFYIVSVFIVMSCALAIFSHQRAGVNSKGNCVIPVK